jgi:hypothetical protein
MDNMRPVHNISMKITWMLRPQRAPRHSRKMNSRVKQMLTNLCRPLLMPPLSIASIKSSTILGESCGVAAAYDNNSRSGLIDRVIKVMHRRRM